jgi:NADPH-ferrihemoprotein reductase
MGGNGVGADLGDQDDEIVSNQPCKSMPFFVFGLGNKTYEHYNAMGKRLNMRLKQLGAVEVAPFGQGLTTLTKAMTMDRLKRIISSGRVH